MTTQPPRSAIERVLQPGNFFVAAPGRLRIEHVASEEVSWEIFRGHLLEPASTRRRATFESWHVWLDTDASTPGAPVVSLKWQVAESKLYVTRNLLIHGFEAYDEAPGVIGSRPTQKWVEELVATFDPREIRPDDLDEELTIAVRQAVVGTSRLPITSLESPLPGFSLGQFAYVPELRSASEPYRDPSVLLAAALASDLSPRLAAHALEVALRATDDDRWAELRTVIDAELQRDARFRDRWPPLLRALFNGVALSPYTQFVDRLLRLLQELAEPQRLGIEPVADVVSYMLRHLCRHLTAFDLTVFHNFGANYPDALFLDGLLKRYLQLLEQQPRLAETLENSGSDARGRIRRRALRQACLMRKQYEGHRVPDAPTSMGENTRVLPAPHVRVPDEQIFQPARRRRRLFEGESVESLLSDATRAIFDQSLIDLALASEQRELGTAHFLDRPLGVLKEPGEIDRTPLVSYVAYSRAITRRRLAQLKSYRWISEADRAQYQAALDVLKPAGVATAEVASRERPGVISLVDAGKVAGDFQLLHSTAGSLAELFSHYDLGQLSASAPAIGAWLHSDEPKLLVAHAPAGQPATLRLYDRAGNLRLELAFDSRQNKPVGYRQRKGVELLDRLQVVQWRDRADSNEKNELASCGSGVWLDAR